ncbi:MAG TPA: hypothetical protein DCQ83_06650 [Fibrobacteres bacterium]|jgi:hypothetical protein|nr:hypothetical protein [Fibrobacterota bacterium]
MKWRQLLFCTILTQVSIPAADYTDHRDQRFGVELNILWPLPPFSTYEIKFRGKVGSGIEGVVGYARQLWTYKGKRHNPGHMDSHALLLGTRSYLFGTNTSVEYTAWLCHDVFHHDNGQTYRGFSLNNEFYLGYSYYFPHSRVYVLPQVNASFWSYKSYSMPLNDLYVFDSFPKLSVGTDF